MALSNAMGMLEMCLSDVIRVVKKASIKSFWFVISEEGPDPLWYADNPFLSEQIDHGLYVTLTETFKKQYAELWRAIFQLDISTLERITTEWGMGKGSAELFAVSKAWCKGRRK